MSYFLYINGNLIQLSPTSPIAQTKQVNDIFSLNTMQTNYTPAFSFPKTASNVRAMNKLGLVGNQSNIPYQKNIADLYSQSGECFIYKGWAIITDTGNDYKCHIYDGNLELYKIVENKMCSDLDLTDIAHEKTVPNVIASFADTLPYKYILADFNGKAVYGDGKINIDYLVPSIRLSWLVQKIEEFSGYAINGSFKTNPDYLNRWITYPKGTPEKLESTDIFISTDLVRAGVFDLIVVTNSLDTGDVTLGVDSKTFTANLSNSITLEIISDFRSTMKSIYKGNIRYYYIKSNIYIVVNGVDMLIGFNDKDGAVKTTSYTFNINEGDVFYFKMIPEIQAYITEFGGNFVIPTLHSVTGGFSRIDIHKYDAISFDFVDEFKKLPIKTVLNEIIWAFGLTLFKRKYSNIYDLKTVSEITNSDSAINWSKKLKSKESESYIYGSYAQFNRMRYKYNNLESTYHDGILAIDNKNLNESKTIIQSEMFAPERNSSNALGFTTNTYKLWDKTIKDDGTVDYKALSDKFYIMKSENKIFDTVKTIGSAFTLVEDTILNAPVESFKKMDFSSIISDNYSEISTMLNKSKLLNVTMWLTDKDVSNIDFSVPYYIELEGGYFRLNKINNFVPGKPTKVEIIRINYSQEKILGHYSKQHYSPLHYL